MDAASLLRALAALLFVIGLIYLLAFLGRKFDLPRRLSGVGRGSARLGVEEVLYIDAKHRLLLIRRDQTQHLVCIAPNGVYTVETGIAPLPAPLANSLTASSSAPGAAQTPEHKTTEHKGSA